MLFVLDSGNRLYQTLGNLKMNPKTGIAIPDFLTGDILYLTGSTTILMGEDASALLPRTKLAVKITVSKSIFVKSGMPVKGKVIDYSPYNPPVRYLPSERDPLMGDSSSNEADISAELVKREILTPSINRFTFRLNSKRGKTIPTWDAGQYMTFHFEDELDMGYAHMNNADPQSLNDDYVRTFTISSPPDEKEDRSTVDLEFTMRKNGPVTGLLWRQGGSTATLRGTHLEVPVLGFGGEERFRMRPGAVFVAAGVGITPLLAQAPGLIAQNADFDVFWSLKAEDAAFAVDTLERIPGLKERIRVYITGGKDGDGAVEELKKELGDKVVSGRRMGENDLKEVMGKQRKFYLCTGPALLEILRKWLAKEDMIWEDFGY